MSSHTPRVHFVRETLGQKLDQGFYAAGSRFLSARAVAQRYGLSYQTADRLLAELAAEGKLVRRPQSGTFVPGRALRYRGVQLLMHPRALEPATFAHEMYRRLSLALEGLGSGALLEETSMNPRLDPDCLPVLWNVPQAVARCVAAGHRGVLVNEQPEVMHADLFDAVGVDNAAGGAIAGEALARLLGRRARLAVLAGPRNDSRSMDRVAGFLSRAWGAVVIHAGGWRESHGRRAGARVARASLDGLFCVNDRLAEGVGQWLEERGHPRPAMVGFDDAPVASPLDLTTVAIPWSAFAGEVRAMAERRLSEPEAPRRRVDLVPELVVRKLDRPERAG